jgi:hypothetical protein
MLRGLPKTSWPATFPSELSDLDASRSPSTSRTTCEGVRVSRDNFEGFLAEAVSSVAFKLTWDYVKAYQTECTLQILLHVLVDHVLQPLV